MEKKTKVTKNMVSIVRNGILGLDDASNYTRYFNKHWCNIYFDKCGSSCCRRKKKIVFDGRSGRLLAAFFVLYCILWHSFFERWILSSKIQVITTRMGIKNDTFYQHGSDSRNHLFTVFYGNGDFFCLLENMRK